MKLTYSTACVMPVGRSINKWRVWYVRMVYNNGHIRYGHAGLDDGLIICVALCALLLDVCIVASFDENSGFLKSLQVMTALKQIIRIN